MKVHAPHILITALCGLLPALAVTTPAQIAAPLDVTASAPICDAAGRLLDGRNPQAAQFGFTGRAGARIHLLDVGPNGRADLPDAAGEPGGDDQLLGETSIGTGIAPNIETSGRFSTSFPWTSPAGARVYVRAFNSDRVETASHWGQSATFLPQRAKVFDVSAHGLTRTDMAKGTDPRAVDSDADGQTDYQEFIAHTDPGQADDVLRVDPGEGGGGPAWVHGVQGRAGRAYQLWRTTNDLGGALSWHVVASTAMLPADQPLVLRDAQPASAPTVVYRVEAVMP